MREIEFRLWNGHNMEFPVYDVAAQYGDKILMQYTGLKDDKGNEIYEGDILNPNWTVVWHECGFYLHIKGLFNNTLYMPMNKKQKCQIIGNIYENPELLK